MEPIPLQDPEVAASFQDPCNVVGFGEEKPVQDAQAPSAIEQLFLQPRSGVPHYDDLEPGQHGSQVIS